MRRVTAVSSIERIGIAPNIEIKTRIADLEEVAHTAAGIADRRSAGPNGRGRRDE